LGAADLRGLLLHAIDAWAPSPAERGPNLVPESARRVFQYLPTLERPDRIAHRTLATRFVYDFERAEAGWRGADDEPLTPAPSRAASDAALVALARDWEAARLESAVDSQRP
jgi:hypothetical protein